MIRRLCLYLLAMCLALPALAAPLHCAPPPGREMSAHHGHHGQREAPAQQAPHDCIGCIARFLTAAVPERAPLIAPLRERPHDALRLARLTSGPDTPPPKA